MQKSQKIPEKPIDYNIDEMLNKLYNKQRLQEDWLIYLCYEVKNILNNESNLLRISCPIVVCGCIGGQFYDLLEIFNLCGEIKENNNKKYLFLGNYGYSSQTTIECLSLLFALKIKYPHQIYLLRGSKEDAYSYLVTDFQKEIENKFDNSKKIFKSFTNVFQYFSYAAIIEDETFCVHSGLYIELNHVSQIEELPKSENKNNQYKEQRYLWTSIPEEDYVNWGLWGRGEMLFGKDITKQFLKRNQLKNMIRGSSLSHTGYLQMHDQKIHSVFSQPHVTRFQNSASVISIDEAMNFDVITFQQKHVEIDEIKELYKKQIDPSLEENFQNNNQYSSDLFSFLSKYSDTNNK